MTAIEYIFVPDRGISQERSLSGREAASQTIIDDSAKQTRMTELLGQRSIEVPLWVVQGGYMIHGNMGQARVVSRLADENMIPSSAAQTAQQAQPVQHISDMFGDAAIKIRLRTPFEMAVGEPRVISFGKKPNIRGSYSTTAAMQMDMAA